MNTIGKRIRLLRHQKSWSQGDVADRLNISIPALSKMETGVTDLNMSRMEQISSLFEMSVVQLLTLNEVEQTEKFELNLDLLTKKLEEREAQVMELQKTMITLYEEIRHNKP